MNIKKTFLSFVAIILLALSTGQVQAGSWGIGFKADYHNIDTDASDDIDSNGTVNTTKTFTTKFSSKRYFLNQIKY